MIFGFFEYFNFDLNKQRTLKPDQDISVDIIYSYMRNCYCDQQHNNKEKKDDY